MEFLKGTAKHMTNVGVVNLGNIKQFLGDLFRIEF